MLNLKINNLNVNEILIMMSVQFQLSFFLFHIPQSCFAACERGSNNLHCLRNSNSRYILELSSQAASCDAYKRMLRHSLPGSPCIRKLSKSLSSTIVQQYYSTCVVLVSCFLRNSSEFRSEKDFSLWKIFGCT